MTREEKDAKELLTTPVQFLKGVGPQFAEVLARLKLNTVRDVLFFFPRDYQDLTDQRLISELVEDKLLSVRGTVEEVDFQPTGPGRTRSGLLLRQGDDYLRAIWYNQPYVQSKYKVGQELFLSGKATFRGGRWQMTHPRIQVIEGTEQETRDKILPVYPLTEGLGQNKIRRIVGPVVESHVGAIEEVFPEDFLKDHDLCPIQEALRQIHFPSDRASLDRARRRLVYQELLILQLALALRRQQQQQHRRAPALEATARIDARIRRLFPFELTAGQNRAIAEISADMARAQPMNRLLEGDVGSGKTVVAVFAILLAVAHGHQAVLMAPTEVLAAQHAQTLEKYLAGGHVRRALLTGSLSAAQRKQTLEKIAEGDIDLVVGTHAVVSVDVRFKSLGLVVIDEQHKFGVRQRATLKAADSDPHYLVMTATPIPRTAAMTLFGDLDVTTLRDAPPGRQTVHTYLAEPEQRDKWWEFFRKKLREGRQGYVVAPLVDPSDQIETPSAEETFEALANGPLEAFRLGLIHGQLSSAQKHTVMEQFRSGEVQVLVATSVVEVGLDVPNATLMAVEGAERFGLAQLHQLRGRIRRASHPAYCCLFADPKTDEARRRLEALVSTTDGFRLAEIDFELRGPGDLFGTRQHGLPPMHIANLQHDQQTLLEARTDAQKLIAQDPELKEDQHARLRRMVFVRYGKELDLGDVG